MTPLSNLQPSFLTSCFEKDDTATTSPTNGSTRRIDWNTVPESLQPSSVDCQLPPDRALHKQGQLSALLEQHILPMVEELLNEKKTTNASPPLHIIEFGAGAGHVGLLLAWLLGRQCCRCKVTLVERKEYACHQATQRAHKAGLTNVAICNRPLHELMSSQTQTKTSTDNPVKDHDDLHFDLGISLHSCGVLTDAALALCLERGAAFCLVPCCYGQAHRNLPQGYLPRCRALQPLKSTKAITTITTKKDNTNEQQRDQTNLCRPSRRKQKDKTAPPFEIVCRAADCTSAVKNDTMDSTDNVEATTQWDENFLLAKRCMQLVDTDRLLWAQHDYNYRQLRVSSLLPLHLTPKNNVISGLPPLAPVDTEKHDGPRSNHRQPQETATSIVMNASASENTQAELGEKRKTGQDGFRTTTPSDNTSPTATAALADANTNHSTVRIIHHPKDDSEEDETDNNDANLLVAFHIQNAFSETDLKKLNDLRLRIPLDLSRPTCPRRFVTEKEYGGDNDNVCSHPRENGWIGEFLNAAVQSWNLPDPSLQCLPWYRFLEYTKGEQQHVMAKHTDGTNVHPATGARSIATMLIYLSTCNDGGGATTLYRRRQHKTKGRQKSKATTEQEANNDVIESISPTYNTALIFPHNWPHSGEAIVQDPKIALRVDLTWTTVSSTDE
mmetsp:Transcript_5015/g.12478  ORF Transcript_5015/g.12478 Transcript_5015/m.12478 type:complete len:669 (-) Transcript_5015:75-2081(-)